MRFLYGLGESEGRLTTLASASSISVIDDEYCVSVGITEKFGEFIWLALSIGLFTLGAVVCREIAGWFMAKVIAKGGDLRNLPFFTAPAAAAAAGGGQASPQPTAGTRPSLWTSGSPTGGSRIDPGEFR